MQEFKRTHTNSYPFSLLIRPCQCGVARPTKWDAEAAKWDLKAGEKNWPKRWSEQQNTFVAKGACCIECEGGPTHSRTTTARPHQHHNSTTTAPQHHHTTTKTPPHHHTGLSWSLLGVSWDRIGANLGATEAILEPLGRLVGQFWGILEPLGSLLEAILSCWGEFAKT